MRHHNLIIKINIISIALLFFVAIMHAENYRLRQLSTNEGLSQQDIECMIQDQLGYIWIGSYDGLNRYDGNSLTVFRHMVNDSNSISDNRIISITEWKSRDEIWIGTEGRGLCCYKQREEKFVSYEDVNSGGKGVIVSLHEYNNAMWVGTMNGLMKVTFDYNNQMIIEDFVLDIKNVNLRVNSIAHDSQGNIVVGTTRGLYCKSPNENIFHQYNTLEIRKIVRDFDGNLWILAEDKVFYYSVSQQQIKSYLSNPYVLDISFRENDFPKSITPVTDRLSILNSKTQIFEVHQKDHKFLFEEINFFNNSFLQNNEIRNTLVDNTMNVWIASSMEGVASFDLNQKIIYHQRIIDEESDNRMPVQAITKDRKNRLWIGSNYGCFVTDYQHKNPQISINQAIFGLLCDAKGNIWCSSLSGAYFFPKGDVSKKRSLFDIPNLPSTILPTDGPYALCEDEANNIIWIGFRSGLLQVRYFENKMTFKHYDKQLFGTDHLSNITKMFLDKETSSLLIGTATSGLFSARLLSNGDIQNVVKIEKNTNKKEDHIWTIFKASDNNIYIGTDSGLKLLKRNEENEYVTCSFDLIDSELQSYKVTSIVEDMQSNLWISTGMGLFSFNLKDKNIRKYLNSDGLRSHTLTEGSYYDSVNNILYVGGVKGLNLLELSSLRVNDIPPRTIIQSMKVNNKYIKPGEVFNKRIILPYSLNYTSEIDLKYFENNISFDFASLHFSNPNKNEYAYKLEGFNSDWVHIGTQHTATFTNLPAGKYILLVKSANGDGVWETSPIQLAISVGVAPWKSIWAYLAYFFFVCMVMFLLYRYFKEKRRTKQELLMEQFEHQKKLEIAEVKLKYHTNITHELRTPLSLIVAPVQDLITAGYQDDFLNTRLRNIKNNADRLLQLIGQFLDLRKIISDKYILRIKRQRIDERILEIKKNFEPIAASKHISFDLYNDANLGYCWCDIEIINKICYNLISNAIKYTPEFGMVSIYVSANTDSTILSISIEDTGVGISESELENIFERFYQAPDSVGGTGIGLHLCQHLTGLHKGTIKVVSRQGEGSIFTVELPVSKNAFDASEIIDIEEVAEQISDLGESEFSLSETSTVRPLILLVEDNYEFKKYLKTTLIEDYNIVEAENGKVGYEIAVSRIPDLIISDIMMPVMDGIELVKKCKENTLTSHVPFLLLTAKDTIESEIEGLTFGAEDYITKPFNTQTLKLKIHNLIKLTGKKEKAEEEKEPALNLNERDYAFISEFEQIVLKNISVPDFGIEDICRIMCISRMQFHRKISAIISKKPSQYIKEIRMKKAYELISEKGLNITETMQEVGYTNHSHFSKLFTEVNGISPRKIMGMKDISQ